ncbi:minor capsid protein [Anaerophilus nitritogenes]|uniref:minor capsid protein n=1 Tax=Anaerophilus nitritogenes TaxID=2498136 RepID=UPI00101DFEBC|nr:minor capsid protein [Anaerophilus nitritogenes]
MKSKEYWNQRIEQVARLQYGKADQYIGGRLKVEYLQAQQSIQKDINMFYQRFAQNNDINLVEAKRLLSGNELAEFKMQLGEFTRLAKNNKDGQWTKTLNNVYYKVRVSRLEALQIQIRNTIENLRLAEEQQYSNLLSDTYKDTYYRTLFEIQRGTGIGVTFAKLDTKTVEKVLRTPWLEENFSTRIWNNKQELIRQLETELTQAIIRGDSLDKTARTIRDRMGVSYRNASRLIRTEASHIQNESTYDSYKASGVVKKYQFLATLDNRTSSVCRSMDNTVFNLNEKQVGINYPPLHANCRSTVVPYFDDEIDKGERIARKGDGKTYYVDGDMSYKQWYDKYVKNDVTETTAERKWENRYSDQKQYEKYKEILGKEAPNSFDKFQELKYNNSEEWETLKNQFKSKTTTTKRDGSTRAQEFSKYWKEASLKDTIYKHIPDYQIEENLNKGKKIYKSNQSNLQIVYDVNGDYFRIEDTIKKGKRRYLDINANDVSNKIENGKQKGRSKDEYEALTHYKNSDKKGAEKK